MDVLTMAVADQEARAPSASLRARAEACPVAPPIECLQRPLPKGIAMPTYASPLARAFGRRWLRDASRSRLMRPESAMDVPPRFSNHLLASLRPCDLAALRTHLTDIELPQETVLFEPGDTMSRVYFPLSGIVSLVVDLTSGQVIETAMIGREGMVGGSSVPDAPLSLNRAVVQVAGVAAMVPIEAIRDLAEQSASFREIMGRHQEHLLAQAQQSTACNAAHPIEGPPFTLAIALP
jgi:CRP-like cAMP-binding protein